MMKGLILFIIATVTVPVFNIIGHVFNFFFALFTWSWKNESEQYEQIAICKDQLSNTTMHNLFNLVMLKRNKSLLYVEGVSIEAILRVASFGDPDVTISAVFGYNKFAGRLTRFGRFWSRFLNNIDKLHVEDALKAELNKYE